MILEKLTASVLDALRTKELGEDLVWKDYHGFTKARLPKELFESIAQKCGVNADEYQAEIVEVKQDLSHEVHLHRHARAYCVALGEDEDFKNPENAFAYLSNEWAKVRQGKVIDIPPNTPHGFTIGPGGNLVFLSIQTPPIEHAEHDDYVLLSNIPSPRF